MSLAEVLLLDSCPSCCVAGHEDAFELLVFCKVPGDGGLNFLLVDLGPAFGATMATMASPKSACGTPMTVGTRNGFNGRFDGGIDVIATRNDEVLGASGNVDVAFRIDIAEVAGDENAVEQASKSLGDLRIAEIVELDMQLDANGKVEAYRSKVKLSFKYEGS